MSCLSMVITQRDLLSNKTNAYTLCKARSLKAGFAFVYISVNFRLNSKVNFLNKNYTLILWLIPIISVAIHWQIFDRDLVGIHVWRQTQTQTVINNYHTEDMNIFHPRINEIRNNERIHKMEFPVMQWTFALFYKAFGNHIAISRILTFIIGLLSTWGIFYLLKRLFDNNAIATIGAWAFSFSPLFYYYTMNPMPDNFALCCGIWSAGFFFKYLQSEKNTALFFSAVMLSLATLAKLPFVLYGAVAFTGMVLTIRKGNIRSGMKIAVAYALALAPAALWYIAVIPTWGGNEVLKGILDSSNNRFTIPDLLQHNLISVLPELLLNYGSVLFFIAGFYFLIVNRKTVHPYFVILAVWGLAVVAYFIFEMQAIGKAHDYYLMPFLPLLFILVSYGAFHLSGSKSRLTGILSFVLLIMLPVSAYLRIHGRWDTESPNFNPVYYHHKKELREMIPPKALCVAGNDESHFILLYYLDRKGWAFDNDLLDGVLLANYVSRGAEYLFSDSRIDMREDIRQHLGDKIFEKDDLRVYKLK